jgi:hypothetical protein
VQFEGSRAAVVEASSGRRGFVPRALEPPLPRFFRRIRCSARTIELEEERLSIVKKHFGDVPLSTITATAIADFQRARHDAGIANRTVNMDVGVLSRVLKFCGRWRALADPRLRVNC